MSIFKRLLGIQRRAKDRKDISPLGKVIVNIGGETFYLADYSPKGIQCAVESSSQVISFEQGSTAIADFVIFGNKKIKVEVKVMWKTPTRFGCRIVSNVEKFQDFIDECLIHLNNN